VPKRSAPQRIADIYTNIEAARRYVTGMTLDQFAADDKTQQDWPEEYERLELEHPEVRWQLFRDLGNRYRHGYDQINLQAVWSDLHGYTSDIQRALANDLSILHLPFGHDQEQ
jgi:uncharacterized protein with HEPN domain